MSDLKIMMAQANPKVGDIDANADIVLEHIADAEKRGVDLLVFSELFLCGYPPEDLLLRPSMARRIERATRRIADAVSGGLYVVVGYPRIDDRGCFNVAGVFHQGKLLGDYAKQRLPNYRVFDEKRYFQEGHGPGVVEIKDVKVGLTICEDIWHPDPIADCKDAGAELVININASPWHTKKHQMRGEVLRMRALESCLPIVYVNMVGGQDELVFDGASMVLSPDGNLAFQSASFESVSDIVHLNLNEKGALVDAPQPTAEAPQPMSALYAALVTSVRDYVNKNGFHGVVLGLSGGIDSALTLAVAVDALGADRVEAIMMPFRYTSQLSQDTAAQQAKTMGVNYRSISIEPMVESFTQALAEEFKGLAPDKTEENIQARCRGVIIMSISNKKGSLVLTTGNKSELAVGYATLYGDMAGGFDVLKDVSKTRVYELARYRNEISPVIPVDVIERPPSAELAPDQKDQDSLPPYDELDQILERYIERDQSAHDIIEQGFDEATVSRVLRMVDLNEYKRRQAPIGPRLTQRAFGRDRRYPITNGWKLGD